MHAPSAPHDHGTHDHDGEHEGELFPRVLTAKLVGEREEQRLGRETRQVWMVGAGLAIVALGLPLSRVLGQTIFSAPLPRAALGFLAELTGAPRERVGFALAAVMFGLSIPLIASTLRAVGFVQHALLPAALIATLSPLGWLGATSATDFCLGVLVCTWLARGLFAHSSVGRLLLVYAFGVILHSDAVWLLPAVTLGASTGPRDNGEESPSRFARALQTGLGGIAMLILARFGGGLAENLPWPLGSGSTRPGTPDLSRALTVLGGLGIGLWGLIAPWTRGAEEVSRPPIWCLLFLILPLPTLFIGGVSMGSWLIPIAALGLADLIQRGQTETGSLRRGLMLLAVQLLLTLGLAWRWEAEDPNRAWREIARAQLEPADLVISDDPRHLYLLVERWGLEACVSTAPDLSDRVARARSAGQRIVRDGAASADEPAVLAGTSVFHLTEAGLSRP